MTTLGQVLLLSLLPGFGNFAGGMVAEVWKIQRLSRRRRLTVSESRYLGSVACPAGEADDHGGSDDRESCANQVRRARRLALDAPQPDQ